MLEILGIFLDVVQMGLDLVVIILMYKFIKDNNKDD